VNVEKMMLPVVSAIGQRPKLSNALFRFAKWGNPFADERYSYPYPLYETYRAGGEVVYSRAYGQWFVFGYDEVLEVLHSGDALTSATSDRMFEISRPHINLSPRTQASFRRWLLVNDPPDHTRLRASVSRAFTPKRIASWEPMIAKVANELVASTAGVSQVDAYDAFSAPLPIFVIAAILGLPQDKWEWLRDASREIGGVLEILNGFDSKSMDRRFDELDRYFTSLITTRRASPEDDLISALVAPVGEVAGAHSNHAPLSNDEVISMISFLMFAGHETTSGLIGNAIVALAKYPDQRALLRNKPELIDNAVEELLRFDSPVQVTARNTVAPITVGGKLIPKGATVGVFVGAANRDKRQWNDPDKLRLDRTDPKPISFGHGMHYCLGAALARLEMRIALPIFLNAFGDYTVDESAVTWKRSHSLRGPIKLPVRRVGNT
jgi:cytochrome P450